jgi:hypothetical protein
MLSKVFKDLYDQGVLIFLDVDNYVVNNVDIDVDIFSDRQKFLQMYTDEVDIGWIYCYTKDLDDVITTIKEDTCCMVEFGFNSTTEKKTMNLGRILTNTLIKYKFMAQWNEKAIKEKKISTVITVEDLPENIKDLINIE